MNVACSTSGCTNPVVGQCSGYKGNCGRFYCAKHSSDGLCPACAARKARDIEEQRMLAEYTQKAESIGVGRGCSSWAFIFGVILVAIGCMIVGFEEFFSCALAVYVGIFVYFTLSPEEKRQAAVDEYDKTHPGFRHFYDVWSEAKKAQQEVENAIYMRALLDGIDAYNHERTRQEVEKAARKINRR